MNTPPAGGELLDDLAADPTAVVASLRHIEQANRWFGGAAALRFGVGRALAGHPPGTVTVLDVGTGCGDLPLHLAQWAARRQWDLCPIGVERHPVAARAARAGGLPMVVACGRQLPLRSGGVDLVTVSQVAHHLDGAALLELFREAHRVARVAVVVSDLRRSHAAAGLFRVGARALRFDQHTVRDGLTSIRRGYTARELTTLAHQSGARARVWSRPGFRLVAVWPGDAA